MPRRTPSATLPSDRAPAHRTTKRDGEGSSRLDTDMSSARVPHLSAEQQLEKAAVNLVVRRKVATAALRQEGADPDALDPNRVRGAAPLPVTAAEAAAAARLDDVRQMLGLDDVLDGFTDRQREAVRAMARLIAGGMLPDAARRVVAGGAR